MYLVPALSGLMQRILDSNKKVRGWWSSFCASRGRRSVFFSCGCAYRVVVYYVFVLRVRSVLSHLLFDCSRSCLASYAAAFFCCFFLCAKVNRNVCLYLVYPVTWCRCFFVFFCLLSFFHGFLQDVVIWLVVHRLVFSRDFVDCPPSSGPGGGLLCAFCDGGRSRLWAAGLPRPNPQARMVSTLAKHTYVNI